MTTQEAHDLIVDLINNLNENDLVNLNNTYCDNCNIDGYIYSNDEEFFSTFYPNAGDGLKVAQAVFYGTYNYSHNWVEFNGYGNLNSYDNISVDNICELPEVIASRIIEEYADFEHIFDFSEIDFNDLED